MQVRIKIIRSWPTKENKNVFSLQVEVLLFSFAQVVTFSLVLIVVKYLKTLVLYVALIGNEYLFR